MGVKASKASRYRYAKRIERAAAGVRGPSPRKKIAFENSIYTSVSLFLPKHIIKASI